MILEIFEGSGEERGLRQVNDLNGIVNSELAFPAARVAFVLGAVRTVQRSDSTSIGIASEKLKFDGHRGMGSVWLGVGENAVRDLCNISARAW